MTDCKNGSDKPNDNTLRLTLMRSPGMQPANNGRPQAYTDQANQYWGHHEFLFGLTGHAGGWRTAQTDWQAYRLNDPLIAFTTTNHAGELGKRFSLLHFSNSRIRLLALKKAERTEEIFVRMVELDGKPAENVSVSFAAPVSAAREINAQEQPVGSATVHDGALVTSFAAYQPRTFALHLSPPSLKLTPIHSQTVALKYDLALASNDDTKTEGGGFDGKGNAIPAEMLPTTIDYNGVAFDLAPSKAGRQTQWSPEARRFICLPASTIASIFWRHPPAETEPRSSRSADAVTLNIRDWGGFIGQWDTRIWKT